MKPNSTFKMQKESKRILATLDRERRHILKNMFITSQLAFEQGRRDALRQKRVDSGDD